MQGVRNPNSDIWNGEQTIAVLRSERRAVTTIQQRIPKTWKPAAKSATKAQQSIGVMLREVHIRSSGKDKD